VKRWKVWCPPLSPDFNLKTDINVDSWKGTLNALLQKQSMFTSCLNFDSWNTKWKISAIDWCLCNAEAHSAGDKNYMQHLIEKNRGSYVPCTPNTILNGTGTVISLQRLKHWIFQNSVPTSQKTVGLNCKEQSINAS
jgi:hypothetical protein